MTNSPLDGLLARTGGVRGLISSSLPVTTFAFTSTAFGRIPAVVAALVTAAIVLIWQIARRESTRPALLGFAGVALCAALVFATGRTKDFYLPGIWISLVMAMVFTGSLLIGRPLVGVVWAWATGRDDSWRRVRRVRRAFALVTLVMAVTSASRFAVQNHLYDTDQTNLLAVARIAMGWPLFVVTTTAALLSIRYAMRALPR
ncbi:DUF3159 domain-containing protein [Mycobacterium sp. 21AC1]|uniref:DUF3159 domain-containing protein n=1 Tax=[Mycobacterium] appelbergii TaxID=2939269 RepID=UPI002938D05B|nr:DUF3159 domain-containing protein [Mycobacterium sp. 21AC1]MDV3129960.1 DUF3159 domain-containing protein [Mycobacterium sp. 21AC1]